MEDLDLTNTTASNKSPEDFRVYGLEDVQPAYSQFEGKMYAGMLPSDNHNRVGMTMFWMFEPDAQSVPDTLVIWLNGGPGCSSFNCGVMMEHSPVTQPLHNAGYCCLKPSPDLNYNEHAWTRATTMLYVEHPIGTGFSYGHPYPQSEKEASGDLDAFLQNFYSVFSHLKTSKLFVMGESYAGMFVPSIARYIHTENKKADKSRFVVPLGGAAIGNGWVNAEVQGPATIDYSWWHGLIDKPTRDALHHEFERCMKSFGDNKEVEPPPFHPFDVQDDCGIMWGILEAAGNPNAYDVTTWDPNVDQVTFTSEAFYNDPQVKAALNVPPEASSHYWHGCQAGEGRRRMMANRRLYMDNDRPVNVVPYIGELLDEGIPFLVYNGDRDMTTNMVGSELVLNAMSWNGEGKWMDAPRGLWEVDDYPAGWAKEHNGLSFVVVYNSGHMVPYNVPTSAFDLLNRFLKNTSFLDEKAPTIRVKAPRSDKSTAGLTTANFRLEEPTQLLGSTSNGDGLWERGGLVIVSVLVGFVIGLLFTNRGRRGYQRLPNASLNE